MEKFGLKKEDGGKHGTVLEHFWVGIWKRIWACSTWARCEAWLIHGYSGTDSGSVQRRRPPMSAVPRENQLSHVTGSG